ncbi:hypothetical protein JKY79_01855 [Candidatus Babeliales bacterium]|nr:hypothetical protein [Candidatus Babeliales bacterium]
MKKVLFLYLLCSMINNAASADVKDPSKRFYVINTDQNKLIVADYQAYQLMKKENIQDKFATVRDQLGKELPKSISIVESIERILQVKDAVVTFLDQDESQVQLRMNNKKESCQILTSKMFQSDQFLKRFGKLVSWYIPEAQPKLQKMQAAQGSLISLAKKAKNKVKKVLKSVDKNIKIADQVIQVATGEEKVISKEVEIIKKETGIAAMQAAVGAVGKIGLIPEMKELYSQLKTELPSRTSKAQESQQKIRAINPLNINQPTVAGLSTVQQKALQPVPATPQILSSISAETKELYLFEYNNSVFLTTDRSRASASLRKRDLQELELTLMPTPSKRQFKKENIAIAQKALQRISKNFDIFVYHNKNKIAKMNYTPGSGVKKVLYFNDIHRNIIKSRFGTAIRYLINFDSDSKGFEAILFKA